MSQRRPAPVEAVPNLLTTSELRQSGLTKRQIALSVAAGSLVRVRVGRYVPARCPPELVEVARLSGRLDCVSLLTLLGVFVHRATGLHVRFPPHATRLPPHPSNLRRHWLPTAAADNALVVEIVEALAQSVRCQPPRSAVATLDSAWHLGLVDDAMLGEVFQRLPRRFRVLRGLLDRRAESGPESLTRLILRTLGCHVEAQARVDGVGRADFVVDGWLIVECDSRQFHSTWEMHEADRRRDAAALERGYVTVRLLAVDILSRPESVRAQLERILEAHIVPLAGKSGRRTGHERRTGDRAHVRPEHGTGNRP